MIDMLIIYAMGIVMAVLHNLDPQAPRRANGDNTIGTPKRKK